jgi:hypothetical protein
MHAESVICMGGTRCIGCIIKVCAFVVLLVQYLVHY